MSVGQHEHVFYVHDNGGRPYKVVVVPSTAVCGTCITADSCRMEGPCEVHVFVEASREADVQGHGLEDGTDGTASSDHSDDDGSTAAAQEPAQASVSGACGTPADSVEEDSSHHTDDADSDVEEEEVRQSDARCCSRRHARTLLTPDEMQCRGCHCLCVWS